MPLNNDYCKQSQGLVGLSMSRVSGSSARQYIHTIENTEELWRMATAVIKKRLFLSLVNANSMYRCSKKRAAPSIMDYNVHTSLVSNFRGALGIFPRAILRSFIDVPRVALKILPSSVCNIIHSSGFQLCHEWQVRLEDGRKSFAYLRMFHYLKGCMQYSSCARISIYK